jgi:hypothetical protein
MLELKVDYRPAVKSGLVERYTTRHYRFGRPDLRIRIRHCYKLIQNKDTRCDKHSEQNSRCNIEKRLQIFLTTTDPTWDVKSGTSAVITHVIHVYQKNVLVRILWLHKTTSIRSNTKGKLQVICDKFVTAS